MSDAFKHRLPTRRITVAKTFTFDAAHHLVGYDGDCARPHGHTYHLAIHLSGFIGHNGLVIDFKDLKALAQKYILASLDHYDLNAVFPDMITSAENLAVWIFERLHDAIDTDLTLRTCYTDQRLRLEKIELWETPTSKVEVTR